MATTTPWSTLGNKCMHTYVGPPRRSHSFGRAQSNSNTDSSRRRHAESQHVALPGGDLGAESRGGFGPCGALRRAALQLRPAPLRCHVAEEAGSGRGSAVGRRRCGQGRVPDGTPGRAVAVGGAKLRVDVRPRGAALHTLHERPCRRRQRGTPPACPAPQHMLLSSASTHAKCAAARAMGSHSQDQDSIIRTGGKSSVLGMLCPSGCSEC